MYQEIYTDPQADRSRLLRVRHAGGTVFVLVMATVALLALLGVSYVQMARMDRIGTEPSEPNNIGAVVQATVSQIKQVLHDDLLFYNFADTPPSTVFFKDERTDEPYDYPWTNPAATATWQVTKWDGTTSFARGGSLDDPWLASTAPDFSGGVNSAEWPHITNLTGIYLYNSNGGDSNLSDGDPMPDEVVISDLPDDADDSDTDTNISLYDGSGPSDLLVDVDGDGVGDSRWTWAPTRRIGDVLYVMAVRIVDNSSLLNLNTATAMTDDGGDSSASYDGLLPRGYYPTGVDLSRLLSRAMVLDAGTNAFMSWSTSGGGRDELEDLLVDLRGMTAGTTTPLTLTQRTGEWLNNARLYGDPRDKLNIQDEYELRYRNGINRRDRTTSMEQTMPRLVGRQYAPDPDTSAIISIHDSRLRYEPASVEDWHMTSATDREKTMAYFEGIKKDETPNKTPNTPVSERGFPHIRHMLTTLSGASVIAPDPADVYPVNLTSNTDRVLKYDLLNEDATATARIANVADRVERVFKITDKTGVNGAYLGLQYNSVTPGVLDGPLLEQIALEYALAIEDYNDTDFDPSTETIGTVIYYGLEPLPFIREVYVQATYEDQDLEPVGTPDGDFETWVLKAGSEAVVVEVGNPFERQIPAAELNGRIKLKIGASEFVVAGASDLESRDTLIFYSTSEAGTTITENDATANPHGIDLQEDLVGSPVTGTWVDIRGNGGELDFVADGNDIVVELLVDVGSGTWVTYDRLTVTDFHLEEEYTHTPNATQENDRHGQGSAARPCTDALTNASISYVSNVNKALINGAMRTPESSGVYVLDRDKINEDDKGFAGDAALDGFQLLVRNDDMQNLAELGWIHMFGFTNEAGTGDFPQRFDAIRAVDARRSFLDFSAGATVPTGWGATPGSRILPHAAMLFEHFTLLGPHVDGIDNDNEDFDDNPATEDDEEIDTLVREIYVPGTININTAPLHIATLGAPLPEPIDDVERLMRTIATYRDASGTTGESLRRDYTGLAVARREPGIAAIGELMWINPDANGVTDPDPTHPAPAPARDVQMYGTDGADNSATMIDLYPPPEDVPPGVLNSAPDSEEERLSRFQFLSQTFSTRSDVYTAYVVIMGYRVNQFDEGPVEFARFYGVFDRSRVSRHDNALLRENDVKLVGLFAY